MKTYSKYKQSHLPLVCEVPEHWRVARSDAFVEVSKNNVANEFMNGKEVFHYSIPVFQETGDGALEPGDDINSNKTLVLGNELLVSKLNPRKAAVLITKPHEQLSVSSTEFVVMTTKKAELKYLYYQYLAHTTRERISAVVQSATRSHQRANPSDISKIWNCFPPKEEQKMIARFLDSNTKDVDIIIEQLLTMLSLLEEERLSVINQAVTKGLDPDVPMKDSGVEWIGKIPKHWEVKKLKFFADIRLGKMLTPEPKDGYSLKQYLRAYNVAWEKVIVEDVNEMWFSPDEEKHLRLQKNDLIVSEGGEVGRCAIWNDELHECYIQNSVQIVRILKQNPNYYLYAFLSAGKKGYFDAIVSRVSIAHLTREKLKEVEFPQPPIPEQDQIRKYLDSEIERIDNTKSKLNKEIKLLQEYRTALISEAVTGKIDVREVKA